MLDPEITHAAEQKSILETSIKTIKEYSMVQLIEEGTHILGNTLDLVITNQPDFINNLVVYPPTLTDHSSIEFRIELTQRE